MLGDRPIQIWIAQYEQSHRNPINRLCHTIGIPLIALSIPLFVVSLFVAGLWYAPASMFVVGWILQFVGHGFEGRPPEFLKDWRFLFVGLRWWFAKVRSREQPPPREAQSRTTVSPATREGNHG